jgi:hypothetical protein
MDDGHHSNIASQKIHSTMTPTLKTTTMTNGRQHAAATRFLFSIVSLLLLCSFSTKVLVVALAPNSRATTTPRMPTCSSTDTNKNIDSTGRRQMLSRAAALFVVAAVAAPPANAAPTDCLADCMKNCKLIAPKDDGSYCRETCDDYCSQTDRTDGLSGSVSGDSGEVNMLGGTYGVGTVVKGEDKPPSLNVPGLDFFSKEGRKIIGY